MTTTSGVDKDLLAPEAMLDAARAATGLHDFGDMRWFEPCSRWLEAVVAEAPLNENGVVALQQSMLAPITSRLRITDLVRRHPEILDEDVSDPVIVVGMPRTGTTKLQRMLASDPGVQRMPFWRLLNPVPLPGEELGENQVRMAMAEGMSSQMREYFPDFFAGHPIIPHEPEEEAFAIEFDTQLSVGRAQVPTYWAWWMSRPHSERAHMYDYLKLVLQAVQWQDAERSLRSEHGHGGGGPFVLKSPMHLGEMRCLTEVFPGATIVNTHRDIDTTVASTARIIELLTGLYTEQIDLPALGDGVLELYSHDTAQNLVDREFLGERLQVVDVAYEDVRTDCLGVIGRIWASRGRTLSADEEAHIRRWEADNPQHQFGRHTYSLERYGITSARIAQAFEAYLDAFPACRSVG